MIRYTQYMITSGMKRKIVHLLKKQDVVKAAVFGSFARNENTLKSDLDLIIKYKGQKSLFDLFDLKENLEKITGKKIDLLTYNSINPKLRSAILKEQKIIYEKRS